MPVDGNSWSCDDSSEKSAKPADAKSTGSTLYTEDEDHAWPLGSTAELASRIEKEKQRKKTSDGPSSLWWRLTKPAENNATKPAENNATKPAENNAEKLNLNSTFLLR